MAEDAALPVNIARNILASPSDVFDAWVNPDVMREWLFKARDNEIRAVEVDLHVGGAFSILEVNNGVEIDHFGKYVQIDQPHHLEFTLQVPSHFPGTSNVTVDISEIATGSVLHFVQTGVDKTLVEQNWEDMLDALEKMFGRPSYD